ncbi:ATP-binding protein [Streptomyces sp. NPDC001970]
MTDHETGLATRPGSCMSPPGAKTANPASPSAKREPGAPVGTGAAGGVRPRARPGAGTSRLGDMLLQAAIAADEREVARARRMVVEFLHFWRLGNVVEAAELLISELVTNSVVHSDGARVSFTLEYADHELMITVSDGSPHDLPAPQRPSAAAEHGRGMLLVDHFAKEWGTSVNGNGTKSIWACLATEAACP